MGKIISYVPFYVLHKPEWYVLTVCNSEFGAVERNFTAVTNNAFIKFHQSKYLRSFAWSFSAGLVAVKLNIQYSKMFFFVVVVVDTNTEIIRQIQFFFYTREQERSSYFGIHHDITYNITSGLYDRASWQIAYEWNQQMHYNFLIIY